MTTKPNIFIIIGSASKHSANEKIVNHIINQTSELFQITVSGDLKVLPHFDPELSTQNPPQSIFDLRQNIDKADGVIICTPEYIFSLPSGLKNVFEWCVATTVFSDKPVGLITASASGSKGHEELKLIMNTIMARFTDDTTLLIRGVKGKFNEQGELSDSQTEAELNTFIEAFSKLL